jgi:hypothetical protein
MLEKEKKIEELLLEIKELAHVLGNLHFLSIKMTLKGYERSTLKMLSEVWHMKERSQSELEDIPESVKKIGELLEELKELIRPVILMP